MVHRARRTKAAMSPYTLHRHRRKFRGASSHPTSILSRLPPQDMRYAYSSTESGDYYHRPVHTHHEVLSGDADWQEYEYLQVTCSWSFPTLLSAPVNAAQATSDSAVQKSYLNTSTCLPRSTLSLPRRPCLTILYSTN
ncbi:hypothetical protein K503DRAFT_474005 [Rhizopogon vinicolor AM-OR11-026]|uniref:Uncharacterized protein n=1 Tax=Rhizopogon vinicolor AM-OR11-026 TaxID=1314800 RepID=A0A1B7MN68_9AGAM|nr:hypothetical protein K503DRAFT_474005 [Rhizopogon vinicolor AM-OR11-026]